jgi:hypothetical protein
MNDIENIFLDFYNKIKKYKLLGVKETKYANLIGRAPHVGKEAWLHAIYKPITQKEITEINNDLHIEMPKVYVDFLMVCNGLSVFGTTISLFGYRYNYIRDLENIWQPFNIITVNNSERPFDAKANHFFFGFYNWDGSNLFIDTDTLKVYRCLEDSVKILNEWETFEDMLISEIDRLMLLFNEDGIKIDKDKQTIPPIKALL